MMIAVVGIRIIEAVVVEETPSCILDVICVVCLLGRERCFGWERGGGASRCRGLDGKGWFAGGIAIAVGLTWWSVTVPGAITVDGWRLTVGGAS